MDKITSELLEEIKEKQTQVVIYGAGRYARIAAEKLRYDGYYIKCHVVTELKNNPVYVCEKPVVEISKLVKDDSVIFVCVQESVQGEIEKILKSHGLNCIYAMSDALCEQWDKENEENEKKDSQSNYFKRYIVPYEQTLCDIAKLRNLSPAEAKIYVGGHLEDEKVHIPRLVVVLGTKCSLRCRECNNLMPHFKPQQDLDIKTIINSLEVLTEKVNSILKCELIGGEPFLSNNLKPALEYVIQNAVIDSVEITTNGTILPSEDIIPLLQNTKVLVRISDYGKLVNKEKILNFLDENHIRYVILDLGSWVSPGGIEKRNRDEETLCRYYRKCNSGYYCKTLYEDKLFSCARAASLFALDYMKEKEYVRIDNALKPDDLKEFILRRFSIACDYCDMTVDDKRYVQVAEQITRG